MYVALCHQRDFNYSIHLIINDYVITRFDNCIDVNAISELISENMT